MEDVAAVDGFSVSCDEDAAGGDALLFAPRAEHFTQGQGEEHFARLALEGHGDPARAQRLHCNKRKLSDPDAGGGEGLHDMEKLFAALVFCRLQEPLEFLP